MALDLKCRDLVPNTCFISASDLKPDLGILIAAERPTIDGHRQCRLMPPLDEGQKAKKANFSEISVEGFCKSIHSSKKDTILHFRYIQGYTEFQGYMARPHGRWKQYVYGAINIGSVVQYVPCRNQKEGRARPSAFADATSMS